MTNHDEQRAQFRAWMADEPDPYYRHQYWLLSLTPGQRVRRWWSIQWPIMVTLLALVLAIGVLAVLTW